MNREQLVEKAGKAAWDHDTEKHGLSPAYGWRPPGEDALNETYRSVAAAVVDALLPQVTTVEELEALPHGVWLMSDRMTQPRPRYWFLDDDIELCGPLTVVWQP